MELAPEAGPILKKAKRDIRKPGKPEDSARLPAEAEDTEDEPSQAERLPDDVLVEIFSWLPPDSVLGAVPLVCKRWRDLSRYKSIWRRMDLISSRMKNEEFCRILRRAPALRSIDISLLHVVPFRQPLSAAFSDNLLCSVEEVKHVGVSFGYGHDSLSYKLLEKYVSQIVHLRIGEIANRTDILGIIAKMKKLKSLVLESEDGFHYDGELEQECPALRKFTLDSRHLDSHCGEKLVLDILSARSPHMRKILIPAHLESDKVEEAAQEKQDKNLNSVDIICFEASGSDDSEQCEPDYDFDDYDYDYDYDHEYDGYEDESDSDGYPCCPL